jgi:hypothetical protein
MNMKNLFAVIGVIIMGASLALAIGGATPTVVSESRWAGAAAGSDTTEGGNITVVNVTGMQLTDQWAAYYGNVSGNIVLGDDTNAVYTWTWTPGTGGEVCLSEGSAFDFSAPILTTGPAIDTAYSLLGADNAANTVTGSTCTLDFATASVVNTAQIDHTSDTYYTCAVNDGAGPAKANYAFCGHLDTATAYNGDAANYEVMVPTSPGAGTETYYFYLELG